MSTTPTLTVVQKNNAVGRKCHIAYIKTLLNVLLSVGVTVLDGYLLGLFLSDVRL